MQTPSQAPQTITRSCKPSTKPPTGKKRESVTASASAATTAAPCQKITRRTLSTLRVCARPQSAQMLAAVCKRLESCTKGTPAGESAAQSFAPAKRSKLADFDDAECRGCRKSYG